MVSVVDQPLFHSHCLRRYNIMCKLIQYVLLGVCLQTLLIYVQSWGVHVCELSFYVYICEFSFANELSTLGYVYLWTHICKLNWEWVLAVVELIWWYHRLDSHPGEESVISTGSDLLWKQLPKEDSWIAVFHVHFLMPSNSSAPSYFRGVAEVFGNTGS